MNDKDKGVVRVPDKKRQLAEILKRQNNGTDRVRKQN